MVRSFLLLALVPLGLHRPTRETADVRGVVREAVTRGAIANAVVVFASGDSVVTDSAGRFALRVPTNATSFEVRHSRYLDFQFPLLTIEADSIAMDIELRRDPPAADSYVAPGILPYLCVTVDATRLSVTNSCAADAHTNGPYQKRIIKHNPWNPYFGRAGDRGGVLLATRLH